MAMIPRQVMITTGFRTLYRRIIEKKKPRQIRKRVLR
jgi:hypothetical protein